MMICMYDFIRVNLIRSSSQLIPPNREAINTPNTPNAATIDCWIRHPGPIDNLDHV